MSFIQFGSFFSTIKTRTRKAPSLFSRLGWLLQPHYLSTQTPKIHPRARSKTQGLQQPLGPGSRSQHSPWQAAVTDTSHHPAQHHSGDEASIKRNISTNPAHPRASRGSASFRGSVKQHQPAGARLQVGRNKPGAFFFLRQDVWQAPVPKLSTSAGRNLDRPGWPSSSSPAPHRKGCEHPSILTTIMCGP